MLATFVSGRPASDERGIAVGALSTMTASCLYERVVSASRSIGMLGSVELAETATTWAYENGVALDFS